MFVNLLAAVVMLLQLDDIWEQMGMKKGLEFACQVICEFD